MVNSNITTVTLTANTEATVEFSNQYYYFFVRNDSENAAYVSLYSGITAGNDSVLYIPAGTSVGTAHGYPVNKLYLLGEGSIQICARNVEVNPL